MRLSNIALVTFVVIGLMLFGCLSGPTTKPNVVNVSNQTQNINQTSSNETNMTNQTVATPTCESLTTGMENCIINRAYENNQYSDCLELNGSYYLQCVNHLAELSYSNCLHFNNSVDTDNCLVNSSAKFGDIACQEVTNASRKEDCILQTISPNCRSITNDTVRYECDAVSKDNVSICTKLSASSDQDNCYVYFSMRKENNCSLVSNGGIRVACTALLENDSSRCQSIVPASVITDNCYKTYALYSSNCSVCKSVMDSVYKDDCFVGCALANNESSQCANAVNEQKADNCYWHYAVNTASLAQCDLIKLISLKSVCVNSVAIENSKPSDCELMLNTYGLTGSDVQSCYLNVLANTNTTLENCQLMNDGYYTDICINNVIHRENLTRDDCGYIKDSALKNSCYTS